MDKLSRYQSVVQKILNEYQQWAAGDTQTDTQQYVSFDKMRNHYFWFHSGWQGKKRSFGVTVYLRIVADKIWIEEDWTKQGIANELLEAGVPSEDIVLGFQHPSKRSLTEFSTGLGPDPGQIIPAVPPDDRLRA